MKYDPEKFDAYAESYDRLHAQSVAASGEGTAYFYEYKIRCLQRLGLCPGTRVLDYGCGIGTMIIHLLNAGCVVHGYDPSEVSLATCRHRAPGVVLYNRTENAPREQFDFVILSGVLHHVPLCDRHRIIADAVGTLRPGGRMVVFEHNLFNLFAKMAVQDCPFDDDAILLRPREIIGLLRTAGLSQIDLRYIVFFPRVLSVLRRFEDTLKWCPLGAQTMTVGVRATS